MNKETIYRMAAVALDGEVSAMEVYHILKILSEAIDESMEQIKSIAVDELAKYKEKEIDGINYKLKSGAGRWDYKDVTQWNDKKKQLKEIEELAKTASKNKSAIIADENGEPINAATYTAGGDVIYREKK